MNDQCIDSCTPQEGFPTPGSPRPSYQGSTFTPQAPNPDLSEAVKAANKDNRERRDRNRSMIDSVGK